MCGITGGININQEQVIKMQDRLVHRGPDDSNILTERNISFGHTRLAIQDIKGGIQPLSVGDYVIIFNGEIYNHQE